MIRVILVDDHVIVRDGVRALLSGQEELSVVGEAGNGRELLELLATTAADVVVLDVNMPEMDGQQATVHIQQQFPEVRVLVLSMLDNEQYVMQMLEAGAMGFVLKNAGRDELLFAIHSVASGRQFLSAELGLDMLHKLHALTVGGGSLKDVKQQSPLSRRELEVLRLIAEGLTTNQIADKLFTSKRTIETHRQNIIEKAQVKNTAALIKYAVMQGLVK
ncbi:MULTISPECIES: response regulator [Hymenobacter]|uniref:Two component transcriptional regulator, LuxR family n=1 Tax=Hymenobacter mucosus TaxID=1411120 RepID=A0A239B1U0_9BACT|nr:MULTISPECIES: response regulator transcription factor [Hymenobacter]SNS01759.1 two component transcriptional regulator, LuxR family [Hymenobacter mucosus]